MYRYLEASPCHAACLANASGEIRYLPLWTSGDAANPLYILPCCTGWICVVCVARNKWLLSPRCVRSITGSIEKQLLMLSRESDLLRANNGLRCCTNA